MKEYSGMLTLVFKHPSITRTQKQALNWSGYSMATRCSTWPCLRCFGKENMGHSFGPLFFQVLHLVAILLVWLGTWTFPDSSSIDLSAIIWVLFRLLWCVTFEDKSQHFVMKLSSDVQVLGNPEMYMDTLWAWLHRLQSLVIFVKQLHAEEIVITFLVEGLIVKEGVMGRCLVPKQLPREISDVFQLFMLEFLCIMSLKAL